MFARRQRTLFIPLVLAAVVLLIGCGGGGDKEGKMAENHPASPGVVIPKPADATQVDVALREWAVAPAQSSVKAGKVYFLAENAGPEHPHELVIVRTNLGPLDLPFQNNKVNEDKLDVVDEIEEFAPRSSASLSVDLTPGKYLLICNITEEDKQIGSHYKKGMVAAFTVE